ncbi:MAG: peptidoglycan DD-metalloendopeptidase family protein [Bacteroidetes bacterium]|nr:peptidoglycan DD-metalloendopeptidase family protein [Bacteroidota bacterium]
MKYLMATLGKYLLLWVMTGLLLAHGTVQAQGREDLEKKRKQKLEEIAYTQKLIDQTSATQRKNLSYLAIIDRQIRNREQLLVTEQHVLEALGQSIGQTTLFVQALEDDLASITKECIEMAYWAFKNRSAYDYVLYVFAASTLQEAWNRMRYIKYYNELRANQMELIRATRESLGSKMDYLQGQIRQKELLIENLHREREKLAGDREERNQVLGELKGKEKEYREKLKDDKRIAKELDEAIEEVIKAEMARSAAAASTAVSGLASTDFAKNRANFMWPISGIVSRPFGRQEHPSLPDVYLNNNGIDIRTEKGAPVRCVFPGAVVHVVYIPGAHNAIIVRHGEYYTVYKNVIDVMVKAGDEISEGQQLGTVSYDEDKGLAELHFEMRYKTEKLDPETWLRRQ